MLVIVGVVLLEIVVILQVAGVIGGAATAALILADTFVGIWLLRREGRRAWSEFRVALADGRWPGDEVAQGALIIVGGMLLVTPGFVTDAVGFLLMVGPTRRFVSGRLRSRVGRGPVAGAGRGRPMSGSSPREGDGLALDVEVVEIEREQPPIGPGEDGPRPRGEDV